MSVEVRTNIKDPLGWIHDDYGVWNLISDYTIMNDTLGLITYITVLLMV